MLDQAIERGVGTVADAPVSLARLFEDLEQEPDWVDPELVERGAKAFRRYGPAVFSVAGATTLLGYTESSIAKPLALTCAYIRASRRAGATWRPRASGSTSPSRVRSVPGGPWPRDSDTRARDACGHSAQGSISPSRVGRGGVGRSDLPVGRALSPYRRQPRPGVRLAADGLPHLHRGRSTDHALLALHRAPDGRAAAVVPGRRPREAIQVSAAFALKRSFSAGADGVELVESYPAAFRPKPGTPDAGDSATSSTIEPSSATRAFSCRPASTAATRCRTPGRGRCIPWCRRRLIFAVETLRRRSTTVERLQDRYACWRRERWWRNGCPPRRSATGRSNGCAADLAAGLPGVKRHT